MYIVQIASECAPVIKAGGLGDVVYGLSREIDCREHCVEVVLPKYDCMRYDHVWGMHQAYRDLYVPWNGGVIHCSVDCGWVHGQLCFFIEPHSVENFFNRGKYYGEWDDQVRFAFFSKAALEFLLKSGKRPDVIHCHDWQTGLIPVMLYEMYAHHGMGNQRVCYSIHNFKHQGVWSTDILSATGLNRISYYASRDRLGDNNNAGSINMMKGGIVYANYVNTVSPHHAWEARFTDIGCGLQPTLEEHQGKFGGILNGVAYDVWDPKVDTSLPVNYGISDFEGKQINKKALRERFLLAAGDKPIVAFIGRLDQQKGVHQVHHGLYYSLANDAQFVLLGSASEPGLNDWFWHEKIHLNENPDCHLEIGYNEELAHLIYAAADIMIVPSNYEPCGLTQIISLKYGTVPVVRGVGGLVNTIFDWDYDEAHQPSERNGFVFYENDAVALESALGRALNLYHKEPELFESLAKQGMDCDYSWKKPGDQYEGVYEHIRHK
ncbi:MAG: glycogen synthase GlgA [Cyanobacteria bacterium P01_F01_bin.3]